MVPGRILVGGLAGGEGPVGEKGEETEVDLWVLAVGAGVDGGGSAMELGSRRQRRAAAVPLRRPWTTGTLPWSFMGARGS